MKKAVLSFLETPLLNEVPAEVKLRNEKGEVDHMNFIPLQDDKLKDFVQVCPSLKTKHSKQVIYVIVCEIISIMNRSSMYKWFPDVIKTVIVTIFVTHIVNNKILIELLEKKNG